MGHRLADARRDLGTCDQEADMTTQPSDDAATFLTLARHFPPDCTLPLEANLDEIKVLGGAILWRRNNHCQCHIMSHNSGA